MQNTDSLISDIRRDGFVTFRNFLPVDLVDEAYREVDDLYSKDNAERVKDGIGDNPHHHGTVGHSILTKPTHLILDLYGKSPALDRLFEIILTHPVSSKVLTEIAGEKIKLRGFNCTRLTGQLDPRPVTGAAPSPHDWHRDSPGEFGFNIFLSDFSRPNQGSTSFIKGSQGFPYCPRWHTLFGEPYHGGLSAFLSLNPFSRVLARRVLKNATGAYGRRGDFVIFLNDTWHGREPNLSGHRGLRVMVGAFPADMPYPDTVADLTSETMARLPPKMREVSPQPRVDIPAQRKPILEEVMAQQISGAHDPIFAAVKAERKFADTVSRILKPLVTLRSAAKRSLRGHFARS